MLTLNTTRTNEHTATKRLQPSLPPDPTRVVEFKAEKTSEVLVFLECSSGSHGGHGKLHRRQRHRKLAQPRQVLRLSRNRRFARRRRSDRSLNPGRGPDRICFDGIRHHSSFVRNTDPPDHVQRRRGPDLLESLHEWTNRAEAHLHRTSV